MSQQFTAIMDVQTDIKMDIMKKNCVLCHPVVSFYLISFGHVCREFNVAGPNDLNLQNSLKS